MIDTKKKIRFCGDEEIEDTLFLTEILFENDEICLCKVDNGQGSENYMLFYKHNGHVLMINSTGKYCAENY